METTKLKPLAEDGMQLDGVAGHDSRRWFAAGGGRLPAMTLLLPLGKRPQDPKGSHDHPLDTHPFLPPYLCI